MSGILLLLLFGKLQDTLYTDTSQAWQWALAYALANVLFSAVFGMADGIGALLMGVLLSFLYAWAYFAVLRRFSDQLVLWLAAYVIGALLPFVLAVAAIG